MVEVTEDTLIRAGDVLTVITDHIHKLQEQYSNVGGDIERARLYGLIHECVELRGIVFEALQEYGINRRSE